MRNYPMEKTIISEGRVEFRPTADFDAEYRRQENELSERYRKLARRARSRRVW